jgi:hypothetical protein
VTFRRFFPRPAPSRGLLLGAVLALAGLAGACAGDEEGIAGCPLLCPGQGLALLDTVLEPVVLDATVDGFPDFGSESGLLIGTAPNDSVDLRAVIRFDTPTTRYAPTAADTLVPITAPDSVRLVVRLDTTATRATDPVTLEVFDVDTAGVADSATSALLPLFRPDRLFGAATVPADSLLRDSLVVWLDPAAIAARLNGPARVRVGVRLRSASRAYLRIGSTEGLRGATLRYRASADSGQPTLTVVPASLTPDAAVGLRGAYIDFPLDAGPPRPVGAGEVGVGGIPGRRFLLVFNVPTAIVDSTSVVRATLELTQRPYRGPVSDDTIAVFPLQPVTRAGEPPERAIRFAVPFGGGLRGSTGTGSYTDSLRLAATDSGLVRFEITSAVREWALSGPNGVVRAFGLRIGNEGLSTGELRFFGGTAPAGVRPRLRLVYTAKPGSGLP